VKFIDVNPPSLCLSLSLSAFTPHLLSGFRVYAPLQVCLCFNAQSTTIATGSMDKTAKLWDIESGDELHTLTVSYSCMEFGR